MWPMNEIMLTVDVACRHPPHWRSRESVRFRGSIIARAKTHSINSTKTMHITAVSAAPQPAPSCRSTPVGDRRYSGGAPRRLRAFAQSRGAAPSVDLYGVPDCAVGQVPGARRLLPHRYDERDFHEHPFWPTIAPAPSVPSEPGRRREARNRGRMVSGQRDDGSARVSHPPDDVRARAKRTGIPIMSDTVFVRVGKLLPNPHDPNYPLVKPSITKILLDFRTSHAGRSFSTATCCSTRIAA